MRVGVVLSSQLVTNDLVSDFGNVVPTDLPISNLPLCVYQLESMNNFCDVVLFTLPNGYKSNWVKNEVVYCPIGISLIDVIKYVVEEIDYATEYIFNFGDTLLNFHYLENSFYVGEPSCHYPTWYYINDTSVFAGVFCIYRSEILRLLNLANSTEKLLEGLSENLNMIYSDNWFDFGNYSSFYNSRKRFLESRHFNSISVSQDSMLTKKSNDSGKIFYEYYWLSHYSNLFPTSCPTPKNFRLLRNSASYDLEYFALPSLSDLFIYGRKSRSFWLDILRLCNNLLLKFRDSQVPSINDFGFYTTKVKERISWEGYKDLGIDQEFIEAQLVMASFLDKADDSLVGGHGDFCFSNILFDSRTSVLKVIDPRGFLSRDLGQSLLVPKNYDVFKLAHSFISGYDVIIASGVEPVEDYPFENDFVELFAIDYRVLYAGLSHLFFTMIPLHVDRSDRQRAFTNLTMRYYANYSTCWKG